MRGLEVQLNGKTLCTAGVAEPDAVLNAIVNIIGRRQADYDMHIRVGGMEKNEFLIWTTTRLTVGDEITIRVVEAPSMDPPSQRKANSPPAQT
jgi:hypothetical protein